MLESGYRYIAQLDSAKDYEEQIRGRRNRIMGMLLAMMGIIILIYAGVRIFMPKSLEITPILGLVVVIFAAVPVLIWNNPRFGLYFLAFSAVTFSQAPLGVERDPVAMIPLFWNIATIGHHFAGSEALGAIHFSLGEMLMLWTIVSWIIRQVVMREWKFYAGPFGLWLGLYILWCCFGFQNGVSKGGDTTFALWELRAQFYFFLAYLMAANLITERQHAMNVLWVILAGIFIKSVVGTVNFARNPNVSADEGVLSHEDSLLMNIVLFGGLLLSVAQVEPKLRRAFVWAVPTAILTSLANGRRAGIASFIVAFIIVIPMCAVLLRDRRKALIKFMIGFSIIGAIYLPIAWNSEGAWALPARAIRSRTSPDGRDAGSDYYRISENVNLKLTRDFSPWFGYGYGRPYIMAFNLAGRNDPFKAILPHNGILWIWMRLGHIGFIIFWMFVATVLIRGAEILKSVRDPRLQAIGILAIATFLMQLIYGEYDMCFANYRTMWTTGTVLGILACLPKIILSKQQERDDQGLGYGGQGTVDDLDVRDVIPTGETEAIESDQPKWRPGRKQLPGWTPGSDW